MLKKLTAALLLLATPAFAENKVPVQQSGTVTNGHFPYWITSGVQGDAGSATDSLLTSLGVTNNGGNGFCVSSARQNAVGRNQLCFGASTAGPAVISLQNYGTATPQSLVFIVNGAQQGFPAVSPLPVPIGNLACFSTTSGGLTDCGQKIASLGTTTTVLHGNPSGAFTFGPVTGADMTANTVGNGQLATMANGTVKCRTTAGTGSPEDCTASQVQSITNQGYMVISVAGVNANSANTDTPVTVTLPTGFTKYRIANVFSYNPSTSLTTATAGMFTGAGGTGVTVVSNVALSALTTGTADTAGSFLNHSVTLSVTAYFNDTTLYYRIGTAQGAPATVDFAIYIQALK